MNDVYILSGYLLAGIYSIWMLWTIRGLQKAVPGQHLWEPTVSVIVPVRNEEKHIVACIRSLLRQNYPAEKLDIWVVNDASTDRSVALLQNHFAAEPGVHILHLDNAGAAPKKAAIAAAIAASQGELIATIDGDCQAAPNWLTTMVRSFTPATAMVAGWVLMNPASTSHLFGRLQALEFLGLVSGGAGAIAMGRPLSVNGANLCYRRQVFEQVQGFSNQEHLASGDDVLLMRKMHEAGWQIAFTPDLHALVLTEPVSSWDEFYQQRKRWASKGLAYKNPGIVILLAGIYLFYLWLLLAIPLAIFSVIKIGHLLPMVFLKLSLDFWLLFIGARQTGQTNLLKYFPLAEIWQLPIIIMVGMAAISGTYRWKGRTYAR